MKKRNVGSSFDSWLHEEGIYEESNCLGSQARPGTASRSCHERKTIIEG